MACAGHRQRRHCPPDRASRRALFADQSRSAQRAMNHPPRAFLNLFMEVTATTTDLEVLR